MSKAMTATEWRSQLKKWGVNVEYLDGWETRGRPDSTVGGPLEPNGIMIHHTGSDSQKQSYIDWLFKTGRPAEGIPAPLANAMTMMDGRLIMGARGKANHAGPGVDWVLKKVIAETVSMLEEIKPGAPGTVNGNPRFYGNEVAYDGGQVMTNPQYATVVRWCAAICDFHHWTAASIIGHGEWTSNKWDPGHTDMALLRRDVAALLKKGPGTTPPSPSIPQPTPTRFRSSVLIQNCASKRSDVGAGSWSKRRQILANVILKSEASFIICPELYSSQRPWMTEAIKSKYGCAGYREGRVLYYRKGRWINRAGFWWKDLLSSIGKGKPAIVDSFQNVENKSYLTVSGWHTSYEPTAEGSRKRRIEVNNGIKWIKGLKLPGRKIYAGDFNSPADRTTRIDDVEPVFESWGYHDLEDDHEVQNGPGHYHLDRVFGGVGVKGERIVTTRHDGSDHPATLVEFSY